MILRNIRIHLRPGSNGLNGVATRTFIDWYDFADWLKQEQEASREVTIVGWNYEDRRL